MRSQNHDSLASERFAQFAAEGSHAALAEALDLVAPELLRSARLLTRRTDEAAELVQDTFVAAIESRHRFESGRTLVPWLVGILYNLHRHRSRARARQFDPAQLIQEAEPEPSVLVDRKLVREAIERGIDRLPPTYRDVVALHLRDGRRPEEIAQLLERPAGRVRTQLWRGLRLLRDALPGGLAPIAIALLAAGSVRAADGRAADAAAPDTEATDAPSSGHTASPPPQTACVTRGGTRWALAMLIPLALFCAVWFGLASWSGWVRPALALQPDASSPRAEPAVARDATDASSRRVAITEDPTASCGSVHARLVWADTSLPAAQQSVRLQAGFRPGTALLDTWFDTVREGRTDRDGAVSFDGVPAGIARLLLDDARVRSSDFTVPAGGRVDHVETLVPVCDIEGLAVDADDRPVADAEIWLSSTGGLMSPGFVAGRSAADGRFALRALSRKWTVWATAPGFARSALYFEPTALGVSRPRLVLGKSPASLEGTVRSSDGTPLAGALVGVFPMSAARASPNGAVAAPCFQIAGRDGRFRLSGLEPGALLVAARAAAVCSRAERVRVGPGDAANVDLVLGRGATLRGRATSVPPTSTLAVGAVPRRPDAATGVLSLLGSMAPVQADGTYCLEHVCPGSLDVELFRSGVSDRIAKATIELVEGQTAEVDLLPVAKLELTGRVVDEQGAPLAGIAVRCQPAPFDWLGMRSEFDQSVTDAAGRFTFAARSNVAYRCFALQQYGLTLAASKASVGGADETLLQVKDTSRTTCSIRGAVCDIADVDLCQIASGATQRFAVGTDGRFTIEPVPPGDYVLLAVERPAGQDPRGSRLARFRLGTGQVLDLGMLAVAAAGELRVAARRADGRPPRVVGYISVQSVPDRILLARMLAGPDGVATLQLAAGEYAVEILGADFLPERRVVTVAPGHRTELTVDVRPAQTCSFSFAPADEQQLARLWLCVEGPDRSLLVNQALPVPDDRVFRIDLGLPPGTSHVHAVSARGLLAECEVIVPAGDAAGGPPIVVARQLQ